MKTFKFICSKCNKMVDDPLKREVKENEQLLDVCPPCSKKTFGEFLRVAIALSGRRKE